MSKTLITIGKLFPGDLFRFAMGYTEIDRYMYVFLYHDFETGNTILLNQGTTVLMEFKCRHDKPVVLLNE